MGHIYQSLYFFNFSFSPMKISVAYFSAAIGASVFKFCTKLDSDELYSYQIKQPHIAYQSLYLFIFLYLQ